MGRQGRKAAPNRAQRPQTNPADAHALVRSALDAHRAGRLDEAADLYAQALAVDPKHPDALHYSGVLAFNRGRLDDAMSLISRALQVAPRYMDAYLNLSEAQNAAGRRLDAIATCRKALSEEPDNTEIRARLAWLLDLAGLYRLAIAHARLALGLEPDSVEALRAKAWGQLNLGGWLKAEEDFQAALRIDPNDRFSLTGYAELGRETQRTEGARKALDHGLAAAPSDPFLLSARARIAEIDGDVEAAVAWHARAVQLSGDAPDLIYLAARLMRDLGRFDEAAELYRRILSRNPEHGRSLYELQRMRRLEDTPSERARLRQLMAAGERLGHHAVLAGFALAEVLAAAGSHDEAFRTWRKVNAFYRGLQHEAGEVFDAAGLKATVDLMIGHGAEEYASVAGAWSNTSEAPVFVVGMPRSGTTLVEQICASHSQVFGAGEPKLMHIAMQAITERNRGAEHLRDWDAAFSRSWADDMASQLQAMAPSALRVIDKAPSNILRVGLIGALFPNARVIWCRRDLRDVVFSNHTNYFGRGNVQSTDLGECAVYARQLDRLGECWRENLNIKILEVSYEALVGDLETEAKRIIEFLGLDWEPGCIRFHEAERLVTTTLSAWQVRQPVHTGSVGRWRPYEKHLGTMFAALSAPE